MLLSQITLNSRKSLNTCLLTYANRTWRSRLKQTYKCQGLFYLCNRDPRINTVSRTFSNVLVNKNEEKQIHGFTQEDEDWNESNPFIGRKRKGFDVEKLHPSALGDLNTLYIAVNNEFKKECIWVNYEKLGQKIKCTIDVMWPSEESFTAEASSKKKAAHEAALLCLNWLHNMKRIKGKKPLLYKNDDHIEILKTQETVNINIQPEFKNQIQELIGVFNNEIKSIVANSSTTDVNEDDLQTEDISSVDTESEFSEAGNYSFGKNFKTKNNKNVDLPIDNYKNEILNYIRDNQVLIIKGDTGCGKSTQVPQFIIDEFKSNGDNCNVIVSEPRRISAVSLAHRVSWERGERVGETVGYHVRFDNAIPQMNGSILYCTTGILLRRLEHDPTLKGVTHLLVDEAHERTLQTDLLMKLFKELLGKNPNLKLIIMSATVNAEVFQQYFSCPVVEVPGKLYPVKMHFMDDINTFCREKSYHNYFTNLDVPYEKVVELIKWIIKNKQPGGILCFLPGWLEIKQLNNMLQNQKLNNLLILSLHSKVPISVQQRVFKPAPHNMTKIILATDIAETGITIEDVSYVIDTAIKRELSWNEHRCLSALNFTRISRANISQRKGRAGRVRPGESYHLITREEYDQLDAYPRPEIFKVPLDEAIITCKTLSDQKTHDFFNSMIESPSTVSIDYAVDNLTKLGILDSDENLTSLGKRVSFFALQPKLSKALVLSSVFQCLDSMISIATLFSDFATPSLSLDETTSIYKDFKEQKESFHKSSDHIAMLRYIDILLQRNNKQSLFDTFKDSKVRNLGRIKNLYLLYADNLISSGMLSSSSIFKNANMYTKNNELIRAVLFAASNQLIKRNAYGYKKGYFTHNANNLITETREQVRIKSDSVNCNRKTWPSDLLTYIYKMDFVKRRSCFVFDTSMISPLSVLLFSHSKAHYNSQEKDDTSSEEKVNIYIDNLVNTNLCCDKETADLLLEFRSILWSIANYIIEYEGKNHNKENLDTVKLYRNNLMSLISTMLRESSKNFDDETDDNIDNQYEGEFIE